MNSTLLFCFSIPSITHLQQEKVCYNVKVTITALDEILNIFFGVTHRIIVTVDFGWQIQKQIHSRVYTHILNKYKTFTKTNNLNKQEKKVINSALSLSK